MTIVEAVFIYSGDYMNHRLLLHRGPHGTTLDWIEKRMYHIQLEILTDVLNLVAGKLIPALVLGANALATTSTVMLTHIDTQRGGHDRRSPLRNGRPSPPEC